MMAAPAPSAQGFCLGLFNAICLESPQFRFNPLQGQAKGNEQWTAGSIQCDRQKINSFCLCAWAGFDQQVTGQCVIPVLVPVSKLLRAVGRCAIAQLLAYTG